MADALKPIDEASIVSTSLVRNANGWFVSHATEIVGGSHPFLPADHGFLPLPSDESSASVAKTAGEWLSVCSDEDVAAVIREALKREGVQIAVFTSAVEEALGRTQ